MLSAPRVLPAADALLDDDSVWEIMINTPDRVMS